LRWIRTGKKAFGPLYVITAFWIKKPIRKHPARKMAGKQIPNKSKIRDSNDRNQEIFTFNGTWLV